MTAEFRSSDAALVAGWSWAVEQAMAYVRHGDPVGDWFEAALPGRNAFCMRDVSHQAAGAQVLGLHAEVKNMLRCFAENIAQSRGWCSYWEITGDNLPAEIDYTSDADFWYNLPANFDVLHCCWRQYLWTGDTDYLTDSVFLNFYDRTVDDYVRHWDTDGDGLLEHLPQYGRRGIGSYEEGVSNIRMGADLIATQFAAYDAYAQIQALHESARVDTGKSAILRDLFAAKSANLRSLYMCDWWNPVAQNYYSLLFDNGNFAPHTNFGTNTFALYFGIIADPARIRLVLDDLIRLFPHTNVESQSYFPEVAYTYGDPQAAYNALLHLIDPALPRREYPEVSYSVVGALVNGLLGIHASAPTRTISTTPHLTAATAWASIEHLPMLDGEVSVSHQGNHSTTLRLEHGTPLLWEAHFAGDHPLLFVNGALQPTTPENGSSHMQTSITIPVQPGESVTVAVP